MLNSNRYENSLKRMQKPIMPSQLPKIKIKMDLAGLSRYAKEKGVSLYQLTEDEKNKYISI